MVRVLCWSCGAHATFNRLESAGVNAFFLAHVQPWVEGWTVEDSYGGHSVVVVRPIPKRHRP